MGSLLWLASYPKSGNTWLRIFLAQWLADARVSINDLAQYGLAGGDTRPDLYEAIEPEFGFEDVPRLRVQVQVNVARRSGLTFFKTHNAIATIRGYPTIVPEVTAGAVYVVRDPRDVAVSYSSHFGVSVDEAIKHLAIRELHTQRSDGGPAYSFLSDWSTNVSSWEKAPFGVHFIRYEDLQADPYAGFKSVLGFLGEPFNRKRLRKAIRNADFKQVSREERSEGFREQSDKNAKFFREGKSTWQDVLTEKQVSRIEADHGDVMQRYGYLE